MDSRTIIDAIKRETGINTDKALAEEMGIKYPTFANWITRNSLQYDEIIPFCEKKGVDMNRIFGKGSTIQNNYGSTGVSVFASGIDTYNAAATGMSENSTIQEFKNKLSNYQKISEKLIVEPFLSELQELYSKYDDKVETIEKALS